MSKVPHGKRDLAKSVYGLRAMAQDCSDGCRDKRVSVDAPPLGMHLPVSDSSYSAKWCDATDTIKYNQVAVEVVPTIRQVEYREPRLRVIETEESEEEEEVPEVAQIEWERRSTECSLYQELSRYYPRAKGLWSRGQLLAEGKHGRTQCTGDSSMTLFLISGA